MISRNADSRERAHTEPRPPEPPARITSSIRAFSAPRRGDVTHRHQSDKHREDLRVIDVVLEKAFGKNPQYGRNCAMQNRTVNRAGAPERPPKIHQNFPDQP